jgi:putative tricarboxylic transport membrane protein|tara:strand:+ start:151 stop:621 length:471 start_codon:yes stop_codon:yes gene_type:complete
VKISTVKIISLLFFIFSAFYLYTAYQIRVFSFDEDAAFNAKTFPIYLGYFGMFIAGLKIALPEKTSEEVDQQFLNYKKTLVLILIMVIYGLTIRSVGFFLSTSLFLISSYYFLGERRWLRMFMLSFPFVAIFMFLIHGLLDIYLTDPILKSLGVIG